MNDPHQEISHHAQNGKRDKLTGAGERGDEKRSGRVKRPSYYGIVDACKTYQFQGFSIISVMQGIKAKKGKWDGVGGKGGGQGHDEAQDLWGGWRRVSGGLLLPI